MTIHNCVRETKKGEMQSDGQEYDVLHSGWNKMTNGPVDYANVEQEERKLGTCGSVPSLCSQMRLLEYSDRFIFEPLDGEVFQSLSIDRIDGKLQLINETTQIYDEPLETLTIYGLVGVIKLLAGLYALVITGREHVGAYNGNPVFQISSMKFIFCNLPLVLLSTEEKKDEAHFIGLLKTVETTPGLFFSYKSNLSLSLQRAYHLAGVQNVQPIWKQADPRFLWNHYMLEDLIECKLEPYILPVIQGSFQALQVPLKEASLKITLISRRCNRRLGTRMWRRGADLEGHAANFVETEQILEINDFMASHIQVRGSIPLLWEQIVDLTYKPTPKLVDAIEMQGNEEILSLAYANAMKTLDNHNIRYVPFDFRRICGHIHFERLSLLYDQIADECNWQSYFLINPKGELKEQHGVVRVNCIDCLDRTNVTQSFLGRKMMELQLWKFGVFDEEETISQHDLFDEHFKHLWAKHGDDISMQYTGTQALKGDFVRHGKRTLFGLLQDGFNALARYYFNNFHDGHKQDAMDLVAGQYTVSRHKPSPFQLNGFEAVAYLPLASSLIMVGITLTTSSIWRAGQNAIYFINSVLWAGFTAGITAAIKLNGQQFCSRPRLCKLI